MKRRQFLKAMMGASVASGGLFLQSPLSLSMREARAAVGDPTLIVIFQRGGCDGLNTIIPYADPAYAGLRPTIAVTPPDFLSDPNRAIDLDGFFGLHPSLASLLPIYQEQNLAILPTVQYANPSRSHFNSQHFIESGISQNGHTGWLNRHLASSTYPSQMRAANFGSSLAQSLRGDIPVASFSSLSSFHLGLNSTDEASLIDHVLPVYEQTPSPASVYRNLIHEFGQMLFGNLDVVKDIDTASYQPENGATYPNTGYGRQLREIAQLVKEPGIDLELATVNIGGWDHHSSQGGGEPEGRQSRNLSQFADGIAALYADLGQRMDDVIILTMTEFGRTAHENGGKGTDHGVASSWFMIGNKVNGGIYNRGHNPLYLNGWPGVANDELVNRRFLDYTIDYRDIMGDILLNHLGNNNLATILPGHAYNPLGLIS